MPAKFPYEIQLAAMLHYSQSMFQNPSNPNYYSADKFFLLLLPAIAQWALELPKHIDAAAKAGRLFLRLPFHVSHITFTLSLQLDKRRN